MINKNVLFPVDTEAFHVIFSFRTRAQWRKKTVTVTTLLVLIATSVTQLLARGTPFTSHREASACFTCVTNPHFND